MDCSPGTCSRPAGRSASWSSFWRPFCAISCSSTGPPSAQPDNPAPVFSLPAAEMLPPERRASRRGCPSFSPELPLFHQSQKKHLPSQVLSFLLRLNSIDASWNRRPQSGAVPSAPYQYFPAGKPSVQAAYSWLPLPGCIGNRSEVGASPSTSGESSGKSKTPSGLQGSEGVLRWRPPDLGRGLLCVMTCQAGTPRLCGDFPI